MTSFRQLAVNVCVSCMTNIVVDHLYHSWWEGTQIQCLTPLLVINFLREALEIVCYHKEEVYLRF